MSAVTSLPASNDPAVDGSSPEASRPLRVLMLGEGLERQGGIVTVEKLILGMADDDLHFHHIATLKNGGALKKIFVFAVAIGRLVISLAKGRADVVHIHVSTGGSVYRQVMTGAITRIAGKPLIMHCHAGKFPDFFAKTPPPIRWLIKLVFKNANRLIALSPHWRKVYGDIIGIPQDRITVLTNPISLPDAIPDRPTRSPVKLLYLGRMSRSKGTFDLLDALVRLPAETKTLIHAKLAGHGEAETMRDQIKRQDLGHMVTILDWVGPDERDALLADADIFLLPSYFEGMPMALLEAMSWGLACVTTPVGGIPDVIDDGENGLLVPAGDTERLSKVIDALVHDRERILQLGDRARREMQFYTTDRYAKALRQLYADVAQR